MTASTDAVALHEKLEAERERLEKQHARLRAEIARSAETQARLLAMLSQFPEVAEALTAGLRPANIDPETWTDLQAFAATGKH